MKPALLIAWTLYSVFPDRRDAADPRAAPAWDYRGVRPDLDAKPLGKWLAVHPAALTFSSHAGSVFPSGA